MHIEHVHRFQDVACHLSDFASSYKDSGRSLFFATTKQSDIDLLSPEHQIAISLLVETIEQTEIFQLLFEQVPNCCEPNRKQSEFQNEVFRIGKLVFILKLFF